MAIDEDLNGIASEGAIPPLIRFEPFELDTVAGELRRDGALVRLQQQPCKVLAVLASRSGRLVTREEIRRSVWGEDTYVNFDQGLNFCVKQIRAALGDNADTPRFVETLPRRGYRFIRPVEWRTPDRDHSDSTGGGLGGRQTPAPRRLRLAAALALAIAAVGWVALRSERAAAPAPGQRLMLAVLPFENLSADPAQDYLSEGLTEELIAQIGRLQPDRLGVIARTSAMRYRVRDKDIDQIGSELGVHYVVEGSVRRGADRVRITVKLIQVSDRTQLWAEAYDRPLRDMLEVQRDVAEAVARAIRLELSPATQAALERRSATDPDPEARDLYLHGLQAWNRRDEAGLLESVDYFRQATQRQPDYAPAYVGLANAYIVLADHGHVPTTEVLPRAREAAKRALELDDGMGEAHGSLAMIHAVFDWRWAEAEAGFRRAIELDPNSASLRQWFAHVLRPQGRHDEALATTVEALKLDPLSLIITFNLGNALYHSGRYREAGDRYLDTLEINGEWAPGHYGLGRALLQLGEAEAGIAAMERAAELPGFRPEALAHLAWGYARLGRRDDTLRVAEQLTLLERQRFVAAYDRAVVLAALDEPGAALGALEQAYREREPMLRMAGVDERLATLRGDPRFSDLLRRLDLGD